MDDKKVWSEKYRPKNLDDIIGHDTIIDCIRKFTQSANFPHLLFYGPPGTGKTTTIHACSNELFGSSKPFMVLELNASDERGIEVVRNRIKQFISSAIVSYGSNDRLKKFKLVILDEIDIMTDDAQSVLRKVMEMHTHNARFCLICNQIKNINPALQSRCSIFRFKPLSHAQVEQKVKDVIKHEKLDIDSECTDILIDNSCGDMRMLYNMMQIIHGHNGKITLNCIKDYFNFPDHVATIEIVKTCINDSFSDAMDNIIKIRSDSDLSMQNIIYHIFKLFNNSIIQSCNVKIIDDIPIKQKATIIKKLNAIDKNISLNMNRFIQTSYLISTLKISLFKN
jgi:replication factor C subunit 3/5